jgi:NAD(P)-dependent dehydrogenase (short-subunit alcohol dehydrogenase family)
MAEQSRIQLAGQHALVTGAARRIGRALALALAEQGVSVVAHYHTSDAQAAELTAAMAEYGVSAWPLQADLEDPTQAETLVERACSLAGNIDILINNASVFPAGTLADMDPHEVTRNVQVNALGPLQAGRALAARCKEGSIINLLDSRIVHYDKNHAAYHLSKRMLFTLTRMMALEFAPNVRVNAVAPGLILPPPGEGDDFLDRLAHSNPLQCKGCPGQVVDAALFLLQNPFITGQVIFVDGGHHMKGSVYGC